MTLNEPTFQNKNCRARSAPIDTPSPHLAYKSILNTLTLMNSHLFISVKVFKMLNAVATFIQFFAKQ